MFFMDLGPLLCQVIFTQSNSLHMLTNFFFYCYFVKTILKSLNLSTWTCLKTFILMSNNSFLSFLSVNRLPTGSGGHFHCLMCIQWVLRYHKSPGVHSQCMVYTMCEDDPSSATLCPSQTLLMLYPFGVTWTKKSWVTFILLFEAEGLKVLGLFLV